MGGLLGGLFGSKKPKTVETAKPVKGAGGKKAKTVAKADKPNGAKGVKAPTGTSPKPAGTTNARKTKKKRKKG